MKALVIGGGVGEQHILAYKQKGLDVTLVETDAERREELAAKHEIAVTDRYDTMLSQVDIVSICTPDKEHFMQAQQALDRGTYVVLEKPPCLTPDELVWLQRFDDRIYCNLPLPWHFKSLIDEFRDQETYLIELDYLWGRHHKLVEGWRSEGGYSIVLGAGIHLFDLAMHFKDEMPVDGAALGANKSGVNAPFDCVQGIIRWQDGTLARININCGFNGAHEHRVGVYAREKHKIENNLSSVDKKPGIIDFVEAIEAKHHIENSRLWRAMALCFELQANA